MGQAPVFDPRYDCGARRQPCRSRTTTGAASAHCGEVSVIASLAGSAPHRQQSLSRPLSRVCSAHMGESKQALVCVVEIPKGGRNKYEYDPQLGGYQNKRICRAFAWSQPGSNR
jgi:hypothetical protein